VKARETHPGGRRAAAREHRRARSTPAVDRDERMTFEDVQQIPLAGQLVVEIARERIVGDEHVRLAAEAPAQRGVRAAAGARQ